MTRTIKVSVSDARYPETVQVVLATSVPGGYADVGVSTLSVDVGKPTDLVFVHAFTNDDAAIGKVTFRAIATIVGARDALPADNTATSLATRVK